MTTFEISTIIEDQDKFGFNTVTYKHQLGKQISPKTADK